MKEQKLLQVFGDIDDDLIEEATHRARPILLYRIGACAAALLLVAAIALLSFGKFTPLMSDPAVTTTVPVHHTATQQATTTKKLPEIAVIPHWEDKTLAERFPEATYGGNTYIVTNHTMDPQFVGQKIGSVTVHGEDVYTDTAHTTTAVLYAVKNIAQHCAVAVQYKDSNAYYSAIQSWYTPKTLGQFVEDLNLEHYLEVGAVYAENSHTPQDHLLSKQDVLRLLREDLSLPNVHDDRYWYKPVFSISVGIPVLGIENVSMAVTADGYLTTNLLRTGKAFFIGTERVEALLQELNITTTTANTTATDNSATTSKPAVPPVISPPYIPE